MTDKLRKAHEGAAAMANLNTFGAVVSLLEGGHLYGPSAHFQHAADTIIRIAKRQMSKELKRYDAAMNAVAATK